MYYDRRLDKELARTVEPGGALSWLMDHVRSAEGAHRHAHIQFRRNRGDRRLGSIQLYWGRTSPLEFKLRGGSQVRLNADSTYRAESAHLFSKTVPIDRLDQLENELRSHLVRIGNLLDRSPKRRRSLVKGEAVCHAGLMRRYGYGWRSGDPLVVIDSEVQIGFRDRPRRDADDAETREQLRLSCWETIPRKLDALGVLAAGDLALAKNLPSSRVGPKGRIEGRVTATVPSETDRLWGVIASDGSLAAGLGCRRNGAAGPTEIRQWRCSLSSMPPTTW